ncbi:DoxX family protein [Rhizobium oryzicola]|uniref:DoxX family protein n=1 Tax=Rhizobium oryzicola TaxID=1232668 RepID=A0ABT8T2D8_9HYPH|nr:DoxX family protein [Rhizobium oryzicola]MDO1584346.1 DoxX family protein [Rhizobium oryzicola]
MTEISRPIRNTTSLAPLAAITGALTALQRLAQPDLVSLALRLALAVPFWKSGILKWDGFLQLSDTAVDLFTQEFMLHLPGGPYPYPAPTLMAFLSGCGEVVFSTLLIIGLATRFAGLGLLGMTLVIQLTVPEGWPIHLTWVAMALAIIRLGPGRMSIDHVIARIWSRSPQVMVS